VPGGGAFFEEGAGAFAFVFGGAEAAEDGGFEGEGLVEREVRAAVDGFDGGGDGEGRHGGEELGEGLRPECQCFSVSGDDFVDEADAKGFGSVDDGASEDHFEGWAAADEAREALAATIAGNETELDLGLAEAGGGGCEAEGAGHGEFAAAAESEAVDTGDDGLAEGLDAAEDAVDAAGELFAGSCVDFRELGDVGAGGEGLGARAAEEDDADGVVEGEGGEELVELAEHEGVERVEDLGAVEGNGGDAVFDGEEQGFAGHLTASDLERSHDLDVSGMTA